MIRKPAPELGRACSAASRPPLEVVTRAAIRFDAADAVELSRRAIVDFDGVSEIAGRLALGLDAGTPFV